MSDFPDLRIDNPWVTSYRGKKNRVDPTRPYDFLAERECMTRGSVVDVATILLTNHECPFRCLMCDLWKNTTDQPVSRGDIPVQIDYALSRLPPAKHLKLYNSGSFFDPAAIPVHDYAEIARLADPFEMVIVESHPVYIGKYSLKFRDLLHSSLQVAIGLETVHPQVLPRLNKHMQLKDFTDAAGFLIAHGISVRAFILLRPPFLSETEGEYWAKQSIDFAFSAGVSSCSVIPVRSGNGALEFLEGEKYFGQPGIGSLERVLEYGIGLNSGPVHADLWDIDRFSSCKRCLKKRKERLTKMNLYQRIYPNIDCTCPG